MRRYLKESLHWLHLAFFKPVTLEAQARRLSNRQATKVYLKTLPVQVVIIFGVIALVSLAFMSEGHPFDWSNALAGAIVGLVAGTVFGLTFRLVDIGASLVVGLGVGLVIGLRGGLNGGMGSEFFGLGLPLGGALVEGLTLGLVFGLFCGLLSGLPVRLMSRSRRWIGFYPVLPVVAGGLVARFMFGPAEALRFVIGYASACILVQFRPFHLVPYAVQLWRSKSAADPFPLFRNSPVYWDEAIAMPLPLLSDWLVQLARFDRERGMSEIANVARLPHQRRAAQRATIAVLVQELAQADTIETIAAAAYDRLVFPADAQLTPAGLGNAARHIVRVAELASDYLTRVTPVGQMSLLDDLQNALESFRDAMTLVKPPVGPAFQSAASRWLEIVKAEEARCRKRIVVDPIPNPFVVGNPLMVRDHNLFKGRKDIIVAIEENIINPAQRPALLLYGRRRIGKTSTLLNLPGLLSSRFVPVFIDCQEAKWREGDAAFCYHLAASIHDVLNHRSLAEKSPRPRLELFERYAFTRLGEYLDHIEEISKSAHKQILLTFDEYEKLEEGISASKVTTEVYNQLRNIVQHRERIVVLFSGGHRFEEMNTINWSDYLINVKTLELSFLAPDDARELITEPVPLLQYESGVIEQIIEMTHCQPYMLQAVASDLVNYLNSVKRILATAADVEVAVEKVLVTAQAYFFYTWTEDCSEAEREILRTIAIGDMNSHAPAEHQARLQSLCHKEILERQSNGYRFSIELFRRWVLKNQTTQAFPHGDLSKPSELEYADLQSTHT